LIKFGFIHNKTINDGGLKMGNWAKHEFGRDTLPNRCYLFAGTTPDHVKNSILEHYEEIILHRHDVYERYIVRDKQQEDLLIFQAYGAAVVADILSILKDGEVEEVIFIGTAFGLSNKLNTGDVVVPNKVQCLDGITNLMDSATYVVPDGESRKRVFDLLNEHKVDLKEGLTVSVPTTFWRLDNSKFDSDIIALEMELSAFFHFSYKLRLKAAGILIISDTINHSLLDDQTLRFTNIISTFSIIKSKG
jgi:hypothetical protein